ncbi:MAG: DNA primase [Lachnospiraceae bacterium]|nr:DNA primase [Lachnospiraceae bacterium]
MPYYPDELLEEVRQRTDIVDLISGYVRLERRGANYFGLCPFHNEKSPSFSVSPAKQMFFCFGCHAGGNVFTFLQKHDSLSFPEAVEQLAQKAGVELPKISETEEGRMARSRRERLYAINTEAAKYYYRALRSPQGELGMKYFRGRQLSDETLRRFGLGYSLQYSDDLARSLKKLGYSDEELRDAGLCVYNEKYGLRDKFINRVMFPIQNATGKVIGFGGRVMGEGEPKYLNSPETEIFEKRKNLYGLHLARSSRASNFILCEGYMDVISLHQAGFDQAMASLGTSFTMEQAMMLKRFGRPVLLAYDTDGPGVSAALRALKILRSCGMRGKVIHMEPHKDPDEFIKALGAEEYQKRIDEAENGFLFEIRILRRDYHTEDPGDKTAFGQEVAKRLCAFPDEMERENYLEAVSEQYGIPREALKKQVIAEASKEGLKEERSVKPLAAAQSSRPGHEEHERYAQRLLLTWLSEEAERYACVRDYVDAEDFTDPVYRRVAERMFAEPDKGPPEPAALIDMFSDADEQQEASALFHTRLDAELEGEDREKAFRDIVLSIKQARFDRVKTDGHAGLSEVLRQQKLLEELRGKSSLKKE